MCDTMMFPDTVEEFVEQYKMTCQAYSNGTEYIPVFRMKQWFEHCENAISKENAVIDACRAAVDKYGADSQVKKAVEELAELQVELCHYLCGRGELSQISEEMADVDIMFKQLLIIFGNDNFVAEWEKVKAARLMERVNEHRTD